jgi:hypothetical protein
MPKPSPGGVAKHAEAGDAERVPLAENDFHRVCLHCGALLVDRACKRRCPRCHFFTDCSDPW